MRVSGVNISIFLTALFLVSSLASAVIVIQDDFNYDVPQGTVTDFVANSFVQQGPWTLVKSEENPNNVARGYLYTVDNTEFATNTGYALTMPGNSGYTLLINSLAGTSWRSDPLYPDNHINHQTDFYLETRNASNREHIPGDAWIQFWVYINNNTQQVSELNERSGKFIYPCNGAYPCNPNNSWIVEFGTAPGTASINQNLVSDGVYFVIRDNTAGQLQWTGGNSWDGNYIGHNLDASTYVHLNGWWLVKMHISTLDTATGNTFEQWLRPLGGDWVKVSEWISGTTPDFVWTIDPGQVGGHYGFKMPTTIPANSPNVNSPPIDIYMYMRDFIIATSESDLPTYNDSTPQPTGTIIHRDDFEYVANRVDEGYTAGNNPFITQGGWSWAKSMQYAEPGSLAYLYTTTSIEGYTGPMPSGNRVLAFNQLSGTYTGQTDSYLRFGDDYTEGVSNPSQLDTIPGDIWFQMWIYPQNYGSEVGYTRAGKFLYPSRAYGTVSVGDADGAAWLADFGSYNYPPLEIMPNTARHDLYLYSRSEFGAYEAGTGIYHPEWAQWYWTGTTSADQDIFGQTVNRPIRQNEWNLIKIHIDMDQPNTGSYEAWIRSYGEQSWTKIVEWIDGASVGDGVVNINPNLHVDGSYGHASFKLFTTFGYDSSDARSSTNTDSWIYIDDIVVATSEDALPVYADASGPDTTSPNIQITSPTSVATYVTNAQTLSISGVASDNVGLSSVSWTCDVCTVTSGTATGTTSWSIPSVSLIEGFNTITVTATDTSSNTATDVITINYTTTPLPDTTAPVIQITSPTASATYSTTTSSMAISGTASDDISLDSIVWSCTSGCTGSGTFMATSTWTLPTITLVEGINTISVTVNDTSNNQATGSIDVTYTAPPQGSQNIDVSSIEVDSTYAQGGFSSSNIDDGIIEPTFIIDENWLSYHDNGTGHYIIFNLTTAQFVNNVTVYWSFENGAYDPAQHMDVQVWNGSAFNAVATITNTVPAAISNVDFSAIETTRIKLYQPPYQGRLTQSTLLSLTEVDLFYNAPPQVPVCTPVHEADTACGLQGEPTCGISQSELGSYIGLFFNGDVTITQLIEVIGLWKNKPGC